MRFAFLLCIFICSFRVNAQRSIIDNYKDSLNVLAHRMQRGGNDSVASRDDSIRFEAAKNFQNILTKILSDSTSFEISFDAVKILSVVTPADHSFRLYTWNYPNYEGLLYRYFGFLQMRNKKTKRISLVTLYDASNEIEKPTSRKLKSDQWYGAVYYSLLENKKGGKKCYTLFGWHGKDQFTTQKVIDVLSFDNGAPVFGLPVFKANDVYHYRVIFEFTSQAVMTVRYDPDRKMIVFDHLSASSKKNEPNLNRQLGPDGTYDAFKFKEGHWELIENVNAENNVTPNKPKVKILKDKELKK